MSAFLAGALGVVLSFGILTVWVPERWAVSLYQTGAFALAIVCIYRLLTRASRFPPSMVAAAVAALPLWGLLQLALHQTVYRWDTWNAVLNWTTNLALVLVAAHTLTSARLRDRFLHGLLYFGCAVALIATLQVHTSGGKIFWIFPSGYTDLVLGPFVYRNQYAAFVELLLPLAVVGAIADSTRRFAFAAMAGILYASEIAAASRAGFALVTLEIVVIALLAARRRAAIGWVIVLVAVFTFATGWDVLVRHFREAELFTVRRQLLLSSIQMFLDHPWLGCGLGAWSTAYPAYATFDLGLFANTAHNDWAQWAAEGGAPFLILTIAIAAWTVRPALRSLWGVGLLSVMLHALVDYPFQKPALAGLFFALVGVLASTWKESGVNRLTL